jgi:hypothetical protein
MKRNLGILMIAMAVTVLLTFIYVPHHHHSGMFCATVERCDIDHSDNDRHTAHHGDGTSCVESIKYVVVKQHILKDGAASLMFVSLLPELTNLLIPECTVTNFTYCAPKILYHSFKPYPSDALRAPPAVSFC